MSEEKDCRGQASFDIYLIKSLRKEFVKRLVCPNSLRPIKEKDQWSTWQDQRSKK